MAFVTRLAFAWIDFPGHFHVKSRYRRLLPKSLDTLRILGQTTFVALRRTLLSNGIVMYKKIAVPAVFVKAVLIPTR